MLAAVPTLVNAVGPHPFWGGRPQALHVAIETTRREVIDLLLEHGADVNGANDEYDHWSPLMIAINKRTPAVQDALIARGARVGLLEALMLGDDDRADAFLRDGGLPRYHSEWRVDPRVRANAVRDRSAAGSRRAGGSERPLGIGADRRVQPSRGAG